MRPLLLLASRVAGALLATAVTAAGTPQDSGGHASASAVPLEVHEIAAGVWVHTGMIGDFAPENGGDLANLGFIVGQRCVAVIDSGGSLRVGLGLLAAIRANTSLPVCFVIATHMHPDHLLGHGAFEAPGTQFVAAQRQRQALAARGATYLARQRELLGPLAEGTRVVLPDHPVTGSEDLELGGRRLQLQVWPTAHTDNDLTVRDSATGVLFTGDLLFRQHLPVIDGSLRGWLGSMMRLQALAGTTPVVPGHGPVGDASAFDDEARYLSALAAEVRTGLRDHRTLQQTVDATTLPAGWALADLYHRRNITAAYAELEWEN